MSPEAPPFDAGSYGPGDLVLFVSDVHLYFGGQEYMDQFLAFLRFAAARRPAALFIHGDLFDFYVGPRQGRLPFYRPLFEALSALARGGTRVGVIHGNRDYLMGARFVEAGVEILPGAVRLQMGSSRTLLSHGDEYCIHDRSYQFWARGVLRSAPARLLVRCLPVSWGFWAARRYRRISGRKTASLESRPAGRLDSILDGVRRRLETEPADVVVCGHIHHLAETPMSHPGGVARLLTTGAWESGPNYIAFENGDFHLLRFDPSSPPPSEGRSGG